MAASRTLWVMGLASAAVAVGASGLDASCGEHAAIDKAKAETPIKVRSMGFPPTSFILTSSG